MKKIFKSRLFTFVLGAIIFSGITAVSAYTIFANDIGYTPKDTTWKKSNGEDITNVKDAIDDLYDKVNNPRFINVANGNQVFSSGSSPFKMNLTIVDNSMLTNNNNIMTIKSSGKYAFIYSIGSNASPDSGCSYTGWLKIYVNNELKISKSAACDYNVNINTFELNEDDTFYVELYGDGANYSKLGTVYIYKI